MTADERAGLPSASAIEALAACPGKWQAEQGLEEIRTEENDAYAGTGNRSHDALAGKMVELSEDEAELVSKCELICYELVGRLLPGSEQIDEHREQRLWLRAASCSEVFGPGNTPIFSGQIDRLYVCGKVGLIVDFKSLYGHQASSERNMQLRAYAVLAADFYELTTVHCAIVQPRVSRAPVVVAYEGDALLMPPLKNGGKYPEPYPEPLPEKFANNAEAQLRWILSGAFAENTPRHAGPQCKFCRARLTCPEVNRKLAALVSEPPAVETLSSADLARMLDFKPGALSVFKALEAEAKKRDKAVPGSVPGYCTKDGKEVREITKIQKLYEQLIPFGVTQEEFQGICSTKFTALDKLLAKKPRPTSLRADGKAKPISLKDFSDMATDGCWTKKRNAPVLARTGEAIEEGEE